MDLTALCDKLAGLAEKATPGPYDGCAHVKDPELKCPCGYRGDFHSKATDEVLAFFGDCGCGHQTGCGRDMVKTPATDKECHANARYFAALDPATVLQLVAAIRRLQGEVDAAGVTAIWNAVPELAHKLADKDREIDQLRADVAALVPLAKAYCDMHDKDNNFCTLLPCPVHAARAVLDRLAGEGVK